MNEEKRDSRVDLEKLGSTTMRKNMRGLDKLLAEVATGGKLTLDEERLIDRITFENKGKRFGRFAEEKTKPEYDFPTISKDKSFNSTTKSESKVKKEKIGDRASKKTSDVPMADDLPLGNPSVASGISIADPQNPS